MNSSRDDYERAVLAEVRARLSQGQFLTKEIHIDSLESSREDTSTDLVVRLTLRQDGEPSFFGWRARMWPTSPDLPPELVGQHLVSSLVERLEAGDAVLDGPVEDGVRWLR